MLDFFLFVVSILGLIYIAFAIGFSIIAFKAMSPKKETEEINES